MTNLQLPADRLDVLMRTPLSAGSHASFAHGACAMEMVAYLAGEPHSDRPQCACPVISAFVRAWNDGLPSDEDRDRILKPFLLRLIGSRSTPDVEERRAWLAMDWWIRVQTPAWLDLVQELRPHAAAIRALDAIQDLAALEAATPTLRAATQAADAARDAAGDAVADAAWDAAAATAWVAAWDAAAMAAGPAVGVAAWDAAWDAARAAVRAAAGAAAGAALTPTVKALQSSAADLLDRMIAMREETR